MIKLKVKKITEDAILPTQAHKGDLFDVYANKDMTINSFESTIVPLGIALDIPDGYRVKVFSRSSLPLKKKIVVSNSVGIIDTCLDKDTKITLINGEEDTIENITKRVKNGEKIYVISINEEDGSYAAGLVEKGINNGFKDVYRYYFDKGGYIDCTEDHLFRLNRTSSYKEVKNIKKTNSLTPINLKKDKDGYLIATSWKKDKKYFSVRLHRDIYKNFYNTIYPQVVHHKDKNTSNNNPDNLQGCSYQEHSMKIHNNGEKFSAYRNSKEGKEHQKSFGIRMAHNTNRLKNLYGRDNGLKGYKHTEQAKLNMSLAKKLFWNTNENALIKKQNKIKKQLEYQQIVKRNQEIREKKYQNALDIIKDMLFNNIKINKKNFNNIRNKHKNKENIISFNSLIRKYKNIDNICIESINHKIIKKEYLGKKEVYDLCIKDYHNFFANGVCVHNCYKGELGLICHTLPRVPSYAILNIDNRTPEDIEEELPCINRPVEIKKGDKIAQIQLEKIEDFEIEEVTELDTTNDRGGGFGSTGQ